MTTLFPNLQLRAVLLRHLRESFGFGEEEFDGVPTHFAVALFDDTKLNPNRILEAFFIPVFVEFAETALKEFDQWGLDERIEAYFRLNLEGHESCPEPVNLVELFYDFCRLSRQNRQHRFSKLTASMRAAAYLAEREFQTEPLLAEYRDVVQYFGSFRKGGHLHENGELWDTTKNIQSTLNYLAEILRMASTLPDTSSDFLKDFDETISEYVNVISLYKRMSSSEEVST